MPPISIFILLNIPQGGAFLSIPIIAACIQAFILPTWTLQQLPNWSLCLPLITPQSVQLPAARWVLLNAALIIPSLLFPSTWILFTLSIYRRQSSSDSYFSSQASSPNIPQLASYVSKFQKCICCRTLHMASLLSRICLWLWLFSLPHIHLRHHLLWEVSLSLALVILAQLILL